VLFARAAVGVFAPAARVFDGISFVVLPAWRFGDVFLLCWPFLEITVVY
jgi:hypothetical protein